MKAHCIAITSYPSTVPNLNEHTEVGGIVDVAVKAPSDEEDERIADDESSLDESSAGDAGDKSESDVPGGSDC